jgi:hypothetical protein
MHFSQNPSNSLLTAICIPDARSAKITCIADDDSPAALCATEQHLQRGREHFHTGRYLQSLDEYHRVKQLDPANQDVVYLRGLAY